MVSELLPIQSVNNVDVVDSRLIAEGIVIYNKRTKLSDVFDPLSFKQQFLNLVVCHFEYDKKYLSVYDVLGIIADCCLYTKENFDIGECLLMLIQDWYYPHLSKDELVNVRWIFAGLRYEMYNNISSGVSEIGGLHPAFESQYKQYIPNGTLKTAYSKARQRPDFIIEINNLDYPVECKIQFQKKDIKQCLKYKKIWNTEYCFAVACAFNCEIPSWIKPITISL